MFLSSIQYQASNIRYHLVLTIVFIASVLIAAYYAIQRFVVRERGLEPLR